MSVVPERSHATGSVVAADAMVTVDARSHRRRAIVLVVLGLFQLWLWATRIMNLIDDAGDETVAFLAVHAVLYTSAIVAGGVLVALGVRMGREVRGVARTSAGPGA